MASQKEPEPSLESSFNVDGFYHELQRRFQEQRTIILPILERTQRFLATGSAEPPSKLPHSGQSAAVKGAQPQYVPQSGGQMMGGAAGGGQEWKGEGGR
ncbi:unnamed protein product [Vitrella brassicaformis CCMP3155]|uniref:Uncharacterized protein n=1 Tax=Vitrella brassicaformis (strain CCMP3155) TaxID=1169540 RepID=A0A0G4FZE5_VITBC|nr:unnamed protein product [Vitrella brassicaformis CCMP3155]|eukprot:CEM20898.1 unnamed protein product [Vitrella brassicaformis CCMP3155]